VSTSAIWKKGKKFVCFSSFFSDKSIPSGQNSKDDHMVSYMVRKLSTRILLVLFRIFFRLDNIRARIFTTLRHNFGGEILDSLLKRMSAPLGRPNWGAGGQA